MKLKPTRNRVLIKLIEVEETSKGGIIIPNQGKTQPTTGEVIATGVPEYNTIIKEGDIVLFGKFAGTNIKVDNEMFTIMNIDEVLAVME